MACSKAKESTADSPANADHVPLPTITVSAAVPAEAAGVVVMRSPPSLFAAMANLDVLGPPDPSHADGMRTDMDAFLRSRMGLSLTTAERATAFFLPSEGVALILEGVDGEVRGTPLETVHGVSVVEVDGVAVAAIEGQLILGAQAAVVRAVGAATGHEPSLRDSGRPVVEALVRRSEGVTLAAAVDVAMLPREFRSEAEAIGIEQAMLSYGHSGIRAVAYGRPEAMQRLHDEIHRGLENVAQEAERNYSAAMREDDVWSGVGAIVAYHQWAQVQGRLAPTLEGRRLSLHVPVALGDPMVMTAFAGMAAAIAIPSLTKYVRRSKTSEPRVGIAMMFDGAASFFNEEHVARGDVTVVSPQDVAPHRCPSDGRLIGSAGVTPPLSVNCNDGPDGQCVPVSGRPKGPGEYSIDLWLENPVWNELNFVRERPHAFHYDFRWNNIPQDFGACQFTAQAFGDLDDDRVFSTFERSGAADVNGVNAAAGLYIDRELE